MMTLDFGFNSNAGSATGNSQLKANTIHKVRFDKIEFVPAPAGGSESCDISFSNDSGSYKHRLWGYDTNNKQDVTQQTSANGFKNASKFESVMLFFSHLTNAIAPNFVKDIKEGRAKPFAWNQKSKDSAFKQYVNWLAEYLNPMTGTETEIKLLSRTDKEGRVWPAFPAFYTGLKKPDANGKCEVYLKTNFIGRNLKFIDRELVNIAVQQAATPTAMPDVAGTDDLDVPTPKAVDNDDMDLDDLDI